MNRKNRIGAAVWLALVDSNIDLQKKIDGVLTDSQRRERARNWRGYGSRGAQ